MSSPTTTTKVPVIRLDGVSKHFTIRKEKSLKESIVNARRGREFREDFAALSNIDLEIDSGQSIGLVGPNGSGKSTLLKVIGGILTPNSGTVDVRGRIAALLELGAGFHPDLTGRENVYLNASILGLTRAETDKYFEAIVDFSGIERFIDTQVKFYSSGMYVRLAFAVAVHVDPDILLVDEVLAVGDEPFQRKCMEKIRQFQAEGRTIVLVSHSAGQVSEVCSRAVVLEHGHIVEDAEPAIALRRLRAEYEEQIQEEISRQERKAEESAGPGRAPERRGRLTTVRASAAGLTSVEGTPLAFSPGTDLTVSGSMELTRPLDEGWSIAMSIENTVAQVVFATDTRITGQTMPAVDGTFPFEIKVESFRLGAGDYAINVAVRDKAGTDIDRAARTVSLSVPEQGDCAGYIDARTTIRV